MSSSPFEEMPNSETLTSETGSSERSEDMTFEGLSGDPDLKLQMEYGIHNLNDALRTIRLMEHELERVKQRHYDMQDDVYRLAQEASNCCQFQQSLIDSLLGSRLPFELESRVITIQDTCEDIEKIANSLTMIAQE